VVRRVIFVLAVLGGCTLFQSDIPDKSCKTDDDCFRAQGEHCDMATKECVVDTTPDARAPDAQIVGAQAFDSAVAP